MEFALLETSRPSPASMELVPAPEDKLLQDRWLQRSRQKWTNGHKTWKTGVKISDQALKLASKLISLKLLEMASHSMVNTTTTTISVMLPLLSKPQHSAMASHSAEMLKLTVLLLLITVLRLLLKLQKFHKFHLLLELLPLSKLQPSVTASHSARMEPQRSTLKSLMPMLRPKLLLLKPRVQLNKLPEPTTSSTPPSAKIA